MFPCLNDTPSARAEHIMSGRECDRVYARDRRIAESLQRVLLRTHPQEALPGVTVESVYEAVLEEATVGGDSFDAFALNGDDVALVVADATGKGLGAAERVAEVRFALRAFLREHHAPELALARLNDFVCDAQRLGRRDAGTFVTLTLVVVNAASGAAACLCAGGEPPLILRSSGRVEAVQVCGPALGLFSEQGYAQTRIGLEEGDTVVLTTDGLTEARRLAESGPAGSRTGAFLGLDGLARLVAQAAKPEQEVRAPLGRIGRSVFEGARAYAGGAFHDDTCLLMGRREEAGSHGDPRYPVPSPWTATGT
jgi:serine phosphatase RsbU (regulator of sigma subunit)